MRNVFYDLAKNAVARLTWAMAQELREHGIATLAVAPGFMRTERVVEAFRRAGALDALDGPGGPKETTTYLGRAIVALASDERVIEKSGSSWTSARLRASTALRTSTELSRLRSAFPRVRLVRRICACGDRVHQEVHAVHLDQLESTLTASPMPGGPTMARRSPASSPKTAPSSAPSTSAPTGAPPSPRCIPSTSGHAARHVDDVQSQQRPPGRGQPRVCRRRTDHPGPDGQVVLAVHITALLRRDEDRWRVIEARPYACADASHSTGHGPFARKPGVTAGHGFCTGLKSNLPLPS